MTANFLTNSALVGKHRDPVWELRWVPEEAVHNEEEAKSEVLVSTSSDGRVVQWSTRKGWEHRGTNLDHLPLIPRYHDNQDLERTREDKRRRTI
jgi:hypothetical protein